MGRCGSGHFAKGFRQSERFVQLQMAAHYRDGHFGGDFCIFSETTLRRTVECGPVESSGGKNSIRLVTPPPPHSLTPTLNAWTLDVALSDVPITPQ